MMSTAKERIAAHKKRVEELKRARHAFQLQKAEDGENEVFLEAGRARSGSTLSTLSHLYPDARARSGSVLSRLSKPGQEDDGGTPARSGSDAAKAAQSARNAALKSEIDSLKKQVTSLQQEKEAAVDAHKAAAQKLEEAEAEGDTQLALIAKLQEQLSSKVDATAAPSEGSDDAGAQEALKDFQHYVTHLRQKHTEELTAVQEALKTTQEQLQSVSDEYSAKQAEWAGVAEMLMSSSKGASIMQGDADLSIVLEEHQLYKEENAELRGMLEEALVQVDTLGSRLKGHREAQEFLEASLQELEDENQRLQEQVSTSHASQRSVTTRDSHIRELREEVEEMQSKAEASQVEMQRLQQQAEASRTAMDDLQQQLTEALNARQATDTELDTLRAKLQDKDSELDGLRQELVEAEAAAARARAEREQALSQSTMAKAQAEEAAMRAQRAADSEVQAALTSAEGQERELKRLNLQLTEAQSQYESLQSEMEGILTTVRKELAESQGNAQTAAMAGLSLSELVDQLKEDKLRSGRECEQAQAALAEAQARLQEREELLTRVMEHLKSLGPQDGGEGDGDTDALSNLTLQLQRAKDEHDHMQDAITQLEDEVDALQAKVRGLETERKDLARSKEELEASLSGTQDDLRDVSGRLEEREAMLKQVMDFLKGAKEGNDADGADTGEGGDDKDASFAAMGLDALAEQLAEAERERERLRKACVAAENELAQSKEEVARVTQALRDEEDARAAQAEELEQTQRREKMLQEKVGDLEASEAALRDQLSAAEEKVKALETELQAKTDELDAIRAELESVSANMRAAAEAGLSLTEMLNKLKEEHAAKVAALEAEISDLKKKVAEYERILQGVKEMLENQGEQGDADAGDIIAQLKKRLEMSDALQAELERSLREMEEELAAKDSELAQLRQDLEQLQLRKSQLEERLADLQQQYDELDAQYRKLEALLASAGGHGDDREEELVQEGAAADMSMGERLQKLLQELREQAEEIARLKAAEASLRSQVEQLEKDKAEAQDTIADLEDQVAALQQAREEVEGKLERAMERIHELELEIARLKAQLEKLKTLTATQRLALEQHKEVIEKLRHHTTDTAHTLLKKEHTEHRDEVEDMARVTALQEELRRRDQLIEELKDRLRRERELLRRRYLSKWRNDTPSCEGCGLNFSLRVRRHHCRLCGKVMCHACCSDRVRTSSNRRPVRVCRDCFDLIVDIEQEEQDVMQDARTAYEQAREKADDNALVSVTLHKHQANDPVGADFHYEDLDFELKVTVARVLDKTPASAAGLKPGMLIMGINGQEVSEMLQEQFQEILRSEKDIVLETVTATAMERARAMSQLTDYASDTSGTTTTTTTTTAPPTSTAAATAAAAKATTTKPATTVATATRHQSKDQGAGSTAASPTTQKKGNQSGQQRKQRGEGLSTAVAGVAATVGGAKQHNTLRPISPRGNLDVHGEANGARSVTLTPVSQSTSPHPPQQQQQQQQQQQHQQQQQQQSHAQQQGRTATTGGKKTKKQEGSGAKATVFPAAKQELKRPESNGRKQQEATTASTASWNPFAATTIETQKKQQPKQKREEQQKPKQQQQKREVAQQKQKQKQPQKQVEAVQSTAPEQTSASVTLKPPSPVKSEAVTNGTSHTAPVAVQNGDSRPPVRKVSSSFWDDDDEDIDF